MGNQAIGHRYKAMGTRTTGNEARPLKTTPSRGELRIIGSRSEEVNPSPDVDRLTC